MLKPHGIFVYGTLMGSLDGTPIPATCGGIMYNLGAFPGVIPCSPSESTVAGEFYPLPSLHTIARLDAYEAVPRLYRRELTTVTLHDGTERQAWIYYLQPDMLSPISQPIPSGNWRTRND